MNLSGSFTIENIVELINGLNNPLHNKQYESKLKIISNQYGFGVALAKLSSDKNVDPLNRQFSAILLKQYIQSHWEDINGGEDFEVEEEPQQPKVEKRFATKEEKSEIKKLLSPSLSDPSSKIRTAIAMCIAKIGSFEWPHDWPELVDNLVNCLNPNNLDLLNGAIKCLEILSDPEFLSDEQMERLMELVFPIYTELLTKDINPMEHIRIVNVFRNTVTHVTYVRSISKVLSNKLTKFLPNWIPIFINHLSRVIDLSSQHVNHHFTIMTGIIEIMTLLIQDYPKKMGAYIQQIISPIWTLFNSCFPIYEKAEINPTHGIVSNFVEEGITKIDRLVSSIFDFILQIVSNKNFREIFKPYLKQIYLTSLHYMQMNYELIEFWEEEPNQYLESEDDNTYAPRVVSTQLVSDISDTYGEQGISSLYESLSECFNEANNLKKDNQHWWKIREAALYALSNSSESLIKSKLFDSQKFLESNLIQDFHDHPNTPKVGLDILKSRSIICASKFAKNVDHTISLQFFKQAIHLLSSDDSPLQLKLSSIVAIGGFAKIEHDIILPYLPDTLKILAGLLSQLNGDSLILLLESIQLLTKIDKDVTGQMEPILTQNLTTVWVNYANDPTISDVLKDIFRTICACPKSYPGILQRMIPTLNIILNAYNNPLYLAVADSAVDITGVIMARIEQTIDQYLLDQLFAPLLNILMTGSQQSDRSIIKATLYSILPFIYKTSPELLLNWKFTPKNSDQSISGLDATYLICKRILFEFDPLVSVDVPSIINAILVHHTESIKNNLSSLFELTLQAFYMAKIPSQKQAFSSTFARLIVQYKNLVIDHLAGIPGPNNKGTALEFVLNEWQKHHFDLTTKLDNNVSLVAMCTLFTLNDQRLESIKIDGKEIMPDSSTRSRSKGNNVKWTQESLYIKVIQNIWDATKMEMEETNKNHNDNDDHHSDDESYDEEDEEDEKEPTKEELKKLYGNIQIDENGFADAEDFAHMDYDNDDDLGYDDEFSESLIDILTKSDPIYNLDMKKYLVDFINGLSTSVSPSVFSQIAPTLNQIKIDNVYGTKK